MDSDESDGRRCRVGRRRDESGAVALANRVFETFVAAELRPRRRARRFSCAAPALAGPPAGGGGARLVQATLIDMQRAVVGVFATFIDMQVVRRDMQVVSTDA